MPWKNEPLTTFPRRLRMVMVARKMNSADIMRASKLGNGQISSYLNGHQEPRIGTLAKLCTALNVSADFLLGLTDDMKRVRGKREDDA